jgi:amidase
LRDVETAVAHEATYPARKSECGAALSGLEYQKIILRRAAFRGRVAALFRDIDLLLVPAQGVAPLTTAQVARLGEDAGMLQALPRFTYPFDMTGSPTITLPCGFTAAGMPMAFLSVGRQLEEETLVTRRPRLPVRHGLAP